MVENLEFYELQNQQILKVDWFLPQVALSNIVSQDVNEIHNKLFPWIIILLQVILDMYSLF